MEFQGLLIVLILLTAGSVVWGSITWRNYTRLKSKLEKGIEVPKKQGAIALRGIMVRDPHESEAFARREEELTSEEEELRQSLAIQHTLLQEIQFKEAGLKAMIDHTNDLIFSLDQDGCVVNFNRTAQAFYEEKRVPFGKGVHLSEVIPLADPEQIKTLLAQVKKGNIQKVVFELGSEEAKMFFESFYYPIREEQQTVVGISVMIREVTERVQAELTLQASEEKYAKAFKSTPDAVLISSVDEGKIIELNEGFLTWSGYTREEVEGKSTPELGLWQKGEREYLKELLRKYGKVVELEVHLKIKSGEIRDCLMSGETIEIGGELCFVSVTRDITYKKKNQELLVELLENEKKLNYELSQREEELSANEEELRQSFESQSRLLEQIQLKEANVSALMNNTKDLICSVDNNFCLVEFNASMASFYKRRDLTLYKGMNVESFIHPDHQRGALAALNRAIKGEYYVHLFEVVLEEDIHYFEGYHNPIVNEYDEILGVSVVIRNITARKKAEDARRASEEKYSKGFRSSPDSIVISRLEDDTIIEVNDGFIGNIGWEREVVIGKTITELGFMEDLGTVQQLKELIRRDGRVVNFETTTRRRTGEQRTVLISSELLEIEGEKCLISVGRDISQVKQAQEEIRLSNERLKAVIDHIPVAIWALDKNGTITLSEGKALADMGLKPGEHVGESVYEVYKDKPGHISYVKPGLEQGISSRRVDKVGEGYYEEIITPVWNDQQEITGLIGVSFDVTDVKQKEARLRENEALLNNIIDHLPIGLQIYDRDGAAVKMNEAQRKLLGWNNGEEDTGTYKAMDDPFHVFAGIDKLFERAYQGEMIDHQEQVIDFRKIKDPRYQRDDLAWFSLWLYPLFNEEEEVVAVISLLTDITERKLSEEKIEQKKEELIQVNKLMADYKLMALRSAMNPHFIFNAMNSIQYFISKNERENALIYLSLFSKLIRNILNGTVENKVTIHHEMETLQNYIELENLRFDLRFEVDYEIDGTLEIRHIEIPSLLLQPYVENAILHGLYNKKEKGLLKIKIISHEENVILFVIEDNGVGRQEAKRIKQASQLNNYKSVGMVLTQERLESINKTHNISVNITDLKDEAGKPAGTRIELYVEI